MSTDDHPVGTGSSEELALLQLEACGSGRFIAPHHGDGEVRDVVFGGQMLAQMIVAATIATPGKRVKSLQAVFARAASFKAPLEVFVEPVHVGRVFASQNVSVRQGERNCVQAIVLLDVEEPDLVVHGPPMPDVPGPEESAPASNYLVYPGAEVRIVDDVDLLRADAPVGAAELFLWTRLPGPALDLTASQAVLAWATDGYLIATAMRPHAGIGQEQAHRTISTGVISEALSFHRSFDASQWLLIALESPFAGGGRAYGRAHVFTEDGDLVASFSQESIIRGMGEPSSGGASSASVM